MKFSKAVRTIEPSLTRKLFNMAQNYDDVIDFTLGDPDIVPNESIREAACQAIMGGKTRYSANAGLINLRTVISNCFRKEYGISVDPTTEVVVTVGGMEALYLALQCLIDEGDEVIVPAPYYVNYIQMIRLCGGIPVVVYTDESTGFAISADQIEAAVTDKTVGVIINTPCNPTGEILSAETLRQIATVACKHDLFVISDEVYRTLVYDGKKHESIIKFDGMKDRTIVVDSVSKRFAMTGYRIGYAIAPAELVANMTKLQENVVACAPLPSQYAAIAAYSEFADDSSIVESFLKRRDYLCDAINNIPGLSCRLPAATFYLFVNIKDTGLDSVTFAHRLLESQHVAVVPGITYGKEYDGYVRIAYTLDIEKLRIGSDRIARFIESLSQ